MGGGGKAIKSVIPREKFLQVARGTAKEAFQGLFKGSGGGRRRV